MVDPLLMRGWDWGRERPKSLAASLAPSHSVEDPTRPSHPPDGAHPPLLHLHRKLHLGRIERFQAVYGAEAQVGCQGPSSIGWIWEEKDAEAIRARQEDSTWGQRHPIATSQVLQD